MLDKELILDRAGQEALHRLITRAMGFDRDAAQGFGADALLKTAIRQWKPKAPDPVTDLAEAALGGRDYGDQMDCARALHTVLQGKFRGALGDFSDTGGTRSVHSTGSKTAASTNCVRGNLLESAVYKLAKLIKARKRDNIPRLPNEAPPPRAYTERVRPAREPVAAPDEAAVKEALCKALGIEAASNADISARQILEREVARKRISIPNELLMAIDAKNNRTSGASHEYGDFCKGQYTKKTLRFVTDAVEIIQGFSHSYYAQDPAAQLAEKLRIAREQTGEISLADVIKGYITAHELDIETIVRCFREAPSATSVERHDPIIGKRLAELMHGDPSLFNLPNFRENFIDSLGEALLAAKTAKDKSRPRASRETAPDEEHGHNALPVANGHGPSYIGDATLTITRLPLLRGMRCTMTLQREKERASFSFAVAKPEEVNALLPAIDEALSGLHSSELGFHQIRHVLQQLLEKRGLLEKAAMPR